MRTFQLLIVASLMTGGCHARYKKYVTSIGEVRPQVMVSTGPTVQLAGAVPASDDAVSNAVAAAVDVVQGVRSVKAANRLAEAVDIHGVDRSFKASLRKTLGSGPPFGTTDDPKGSLLQVSVVNYGLQAPVMGMNGVFTYDLHVEIFLSSGKKVYNGHQSCKVGFGDASALSQVLGTVDNVKQLNQMSDSQIQQTFENAATLCGQDLVQKLRQQASSSKLAPTVADDGSPGEGVAIDGDPDAVIAALSGGAGAPADQAETTPTDR